MHARSRLVRRLQPILVLAVVAAVANTRPSAAQPAEEAAVPSAAVSSEAEVAARVDSLIAGGLRDAGVEPVPSASDEDFLRRVSLDLAGRLPTPDDTRRFTSNESPDKRALVVDRLLASDGYARNWARYWRDVVLDRATNQRARIVQPRFEAWLAERFAENAPWDEVATALVTATGDVREEGATALLFAHDGDAAEIAAETSRIFLGIQLSCANCHDHPYDSWKRDDFHTLAAYFPRVRVRPVQEEGRVRSFEVVSQNVLPRPGFGQSGGAFDPVALVTRLDRNRDGEVGRGEVRGSSIAERFEQILARVDANENGTLSAEELRNARPPMPNGQRFQTEYRMPDLDDPSSPGTRVDPAFFVSKEAAAPELSDEDRRLVLAQQITEPANPWFARAYVNRIWGELLGEGFHTPVDDLGPQREARFPEALEALAEGFTASGYDPKWLFRTIALTETYQRQVRSPAADQPLPFASALPTRLRADQVYDALVQILGEPPVGGERFQRPMGAAYGPGFGPRDRFAELFGHDPSTPKEDLLGTVPQALFLMNSRFVNDALRTQVPTRLSALLYGERDDAKVAEELYLSILARRPTERETAIVLEHVREHGHRGEAFEDLAWGLLNSTEFITRR